MQDYAHKNKMLGGLEGVRHTYKLGRLSKRERERAQGALAVCIYVRMTDSDYWEGFCEEIHVVSFWSKGQPLSQVDRAWLDIILFRSRAKADIQFPFSTIPFLLLSHGCTLET